MTRITLTFIRPLSYRIAE